MRLGNACRDRVLLSSKSSVVGRKHKPGTAVPGNSRKGLTHYDFGHELEHRGLAGRTETGRVLNVPRDTASNDKRG